MPVTNFLWHIIIANLLLLTLIAVFIYRNVKDKAFLFYALYNVFLLLYILPKNSEVLDVSFLNQNRFSSTKWYVQIIYNSFITYFGIYFLRVQKHYPKTSKWVDVFLKTVMIVSTLAWLLTIVFNHHSYFFLFFTYGYLPLQLSVGFYFLYLATKVTAKERYYYFVGIFSYILLAMLAFVLSITNNIYTFKPFTAISFFYIGILIESICFVFGLGERVKTMYSEKLKIQKKLASTQQKLNQQLQQKIQKIEIEKKLSELEFTLMTSKMNSHFLFNALNSIKLYIIENDKRSAVNYLGKFSEFIRKVLEISSVKMITLEEELYTSQLYIDIENSRFNYEINFKMEVARDIAINTIKVPPFILQPFLENAIWHGVATKKEKKIRLLIQQQNNTLHISIEDNGIGRKQAQELKNQRKNYKKSIGLHILNQILTNAYGANYKIKFIDLYNEQQQPLGTKVLLTIPCSII